MKLRGLALTAFVMLAPAALALPPPLERPGWYDCSVERQDRSGTLSVTQSLPPEGAGSPRLTLWTPPIERNGVYVFISWEGEAPVRMASGRVLVMLFTPPARVEVRRIGPNGARTTPFTGAFPADDRMAGAGIDWDPFLAMARGAEALDIAAVGSDGRVIRSVRILSRDIERVAGRVAAIQPEFDAVVADRRNRCVFRDPNRMIHIR